MPCLYPPSVPRHQGTSQYPHNKGNKPALRHQGPSSCSRSGSVGERHLLPTSPILSSGKKLALRNVWGEGSYKHTIISILLLLSFSSFIVCNGHDYPHNHCCDCHYHCHRFCYRYTYSRQCHHHQHHHHRLYKAISYKIMHGIYFDWPTLFFTLGSAFGGARSWKKYRNENIMAVVYSLSRACLRCGQFSRFYLLSFFLIYGGVCVFNKFIGR